MKLLGRVAKRQGDSGDTFPVSVVGVASIATGAVYFKN